MKDLEKAFAEGIASLRLAPAGPAERGTENMQDMISFGREEKDDTAWKALTKQYLPTAKTFEIHCWSDEGLWIKLALQYGREKPLDWQDGTVIEGPVTEAFAEMILGEPKPADTEIYNKMTPFFNVFLDSGFFSSHYGTEVYIIQEEIT